MKKQMDTKSKRKKNEIAHKQKIYDWKKNIANRLKTKNKYNETQNL